MQQKTITRRSRKGNAAFTALMALVLLGFTALTVDMGQARKVRAELQAASDAASHAAVAYLNRSTTGCDAALDAGVWWGNENVVNGGTADFQETDILLGVYDFDAGTFTQNDCSDPSATNAVRVRKQINDIDTIFGLAAFGVSNLGAGAQSTMVVPPGTPATAVSCFLPITIPACKVQEFMDSGQGIFEVTTSSNGEDNAAWGVLSGMSADANTFSGQIDPPPGTSCQGAEIGDTVSVNNGSVSTVFSEIRTVLDGTNDGEGEAQWWDTDYWPTETQPDYAEDSIQPRDLNGDGDIQNNEDFTSETTMDSTRFGYSIQGPIMLMNYGDTDGNGVDDFCDPSPPNYTGDHPLVGFAWGALFDVDDQGSDKTIKIQVNTEFDFDEYSTAGGGTKDWGITFQAPSVFID